MSQSVTPSTVTYTSLKNRPVLRIALRTLWVTVFGYIAALLFIELYGSWGDFFAGNLISQITRIGLSLFSFSTIQVFCDLYILLGYFGLAVMLFLRRSDDWFAIFLSLMIMTFGLRVTGIGNDLAARPDTQFLVSPVMMMGEAGIVLFGWLYPDGRFVPRWLKYILPLLIASVGLLYWPASPFYGANIDQVLVLGISLLWYFITVAVITYRYRGVTNLNQRQQIRWVFVGMLGPLFWYILYTVPNVFFPALQANASAVGIIFQAGTRVLSIVLFLAFPACLTIAIARYRLFDVDFIINRTLVYGALTVILVSIFGLVLMAASAALNVFTSGQQTTLGVLVSALVAGALFQPAYKALQRFVDRTLYHIHIDYLKTPAGRKLQPITTDTQTQAPLLFSGYRDLLLIGRGGMAEIYRAEHPALKRKVAIKVLLPNLAVDDQFRKRFMREAQTLADLQHPNIVKLFDYGEENDLYYMVMEYLDGANLSAYLKQNGRIELPRATRILQDVAGALDYAHKSGLIHRDVKPSNVMLDSGTLAERAVLTDFGIAKNTGAHTNITASAVLGTFDYIAPEQIQAATDVDYRADIYSLGVMTYQFLTGALPFKRSGTGALLLAHLSAPPPDACELVPTLPRHTSTAIQRAMAKKPADRYSSAGEFVAALA